MDVWDDTTTGNGSLDQGIQLLVSSDSELQVSWRDSLDFKVLGGVTSELQNLSGQILEDSGTVDCGGGSDSAAGADSALQESMNSSDWEL